MQRNKIKPDINVTPLVDVVLVLLIIFMVVTPQMQKGPAIDPPGAENPDPKTKVSSDPLTVKLSSDGLLFLGDEPVERQALGPALEKARLEEPGRRVVLKADRNVRYAEVRSVFKEAHQLGFAGVALEVGDKRRGGER